ncbi:MAG: hypothetical protein D6776_05095 [Planctomycetota bacterium]|nr:MAG: hypothetical protein D6776_05095 [Planctomycetota bacterium]
MCLNSFPEHELTRSGKRELCPECAALQGVESRQMPRVVVRRPLGAERPAAAPAPPPPPEPIELPELEPNELAEPVALSELAAVTETAVREAAASPAPAVGGASASARAPRAAAATDDPYALDLGSEAAASDHAAVPEAPATPSPLQRFGAELLRCLAEQDLEALRRLYLTEIELRSVVGRERAREQAQLVASRIERDMRSKHSLYFRHPAPVRLLGVEVGRAQRTSGAVVELHEVRIRFEVGGMQRMLQIQRMYRFGERYRLEFLD